MTDKRCNIHRETEPILKVNPEGSYHYGKWVCPECNKYVTHARQPKTNLEVNERQKAIRKYIIEEGIESDKELHRILSMYNTSRLNLVQQELYNKIINTI